MTAATSTSSTWSPLRILLALAAMGALGVALLMVATVMMLSGGTPTSDTSSSPSTLAVADIPPAILPLYLQAGQSFGVDWAILAGIGKVETDHGRSNAPGVHTEVNSFGCCAGPMQFSVIGPNGGTWGTYGVDGNHDGRTDVYDPADAIPAAAKYLKASGAPGDYHAAILAYNHAEWYVAEVMSWATKYRKAEAAPLPAGPSGPGYTQDFTGTWLARIPGTSAMCDSRIVPDVLALLARYRLRAGDCFSLTGHEHAGEHPLGLAIDLTPGTSGNWDLVARLAHDLGWREDCAATGCDGQLPGPFRFIGWNGYPGHGDPAHAGANAHLHLSWQHTPATPGTPAARVQTILPPQ